MRPSFAYILRSARKAKRLTQAQLGGLCDIPQRTISDYETEREIPHSKNLKQLARALGMSTAELGLVAEQALPPRVPLPPAFLESFERASHCHLPKREVSMRARLHSALESFPGYMSLIDDCLKEPGFEAFTRMADCNSGPEALCWAFLAEQGALFSRFRPARLGWRLAPIVDKSYERCLTGALWPALYVTAPQPMVFFPQVRIRGKSLKARVDMLVALGKKGKTEFFGAEINGPDHRGGGDAERAVKLGLPMVFLTVQDVQSPNLAGLILERYLTSS